MLKTKRPDKLVKLTNKSLVSHGIQNEVSRFVGVGKKIVPYIIPFVNNNGIDVTESMRLQGILPTAYSAPATQFDFPAGLTINSNQILRIPLRSPQDSLFYLHTIRYWALQTSENEWPVVAKKATLKNTSQFYDKWNQNTSLTGQYMTHITLAGSAVAPDATVTPPASITAFDTKTLHNGMTFILPIYADDEIDPSSADPESYIQVKIDSMAADGSEFELKDMNGDAYTVKFSGECPVMWPIMYNNASLIAPYTRYLKVALNANSPRKTNIYGGLANVPRRSNDLGVIDNQLNSPHIERIFVDTLQGPDNGFNSIIKKHLFGKDSALTIEIENTFNSDLLVNGYAFGFQIFQRENSI